MIYAIRFSDMALFPVGDFSDWEAILAPQNLNDSLR